VASYVALTDLLVGWLVGCWFTRWQQSVSDSLLLDYVDHRRDFSRIIIYFRQRLKTDLFAKSHFL